MTTAGYCSYEHICRIQELIKLMGLQSIRFIYCYPMNPHFPKGEQAYRLSIGDVFEYNRLQEFLYSKEPKPLNKWTKFIRKIKGWIKNE